MINSRLIKILKTFNKEEWKELDLFLQSPLLTPAKQAENLLKLLKFISNSQPAFSDKKLQKPKAYVYVFNEKKLIKGKLEKLMSSLLKAVRTYIQWKYKHTNEALLPAWQAEIVFYKSKGLSAYQESQLLKVEERLQNPSTIDYHHYWHQLLLAHEWMDFSHATIPQNQIEYYQVENDRLDHYYLLRKLRIAVAVLALGLQQKKENPRELIALEALVSELDEQALIDFPVHRIYIRAFYFLLHFHEEDSSAFELLNKILLEEGKYLVFEKLQMLQTLLRIYAVGRLNKGDEIFLPIAYDLYKKHLGLGYLYYHNKIHSLTLLNLVVIGLKCHDFEWVKSFIQNHDEKILDQENLKAKVDLNWAVFYFYQKEFSKSLDLIPSPDSLENIYYKLQIRRLEIMVYYEQKSVLLDSKMEAFKIYIFRLAKTELPDAYKLLNNHFIDLLRQILQPKTLRNLSRINKISNKIKNTSSVTEREWLLGKLHELRS